MDCSKCLRTGLPGTAFYLTNRTTCRDCIARDHRRNWKQVPTEDRHFLSDRCPKCQTDQRNLHRHYMRWHPHERPPEKPVLVHGIETLNAEVLRVQSGQDQGWSWPDKQQLVYFIQGGSVGRPVKIGTSNVLRKRIEELQNSSPDTLQVLLTYPGGRSVEHELHHRFAAHWIRGEWFQASEEILSFILEKKTGVSPEDPAPRFTPKFYTPRLRKWEDLTYNGVTKSLKDWASDLRMSYSLIRTRLKAGWTVGQALDFEPRDTAGKPGRPPKQVLQV